MNDAPVVSVYAKARQHMLLVLMAMPVIIWVIPLTLTAFGVSNDTVFAIIVPLGFGWVIVGGVRTLLLTCPGCGKSLFKRQIFHVSWPEKSCSKCGRDLTQ